MAAIAASLLLIISMYRMGLLPWFRRPRPCGARRMSRGVDRFRQAPRKNFRLRHAVSQGPGFAKRPAALAMMPRRAILCDPGTSRQRWEMSNGTRDPQEIQKRPVDAVGQGDSRYRREGICLPLW